MGKVFHEGPNTLEQDVAQSWTPSITNSGSGLYEGMRCCCCCCYCCCGCC